MDPAWIEAARNYSKMPGANRSAYWTNLTDEQRQLLQAALSELQTANAPPPPAAQNSLQPQPATPPKRSGGCRRGCFRGCMSVVLVIGIFIAWSIFPWFTKPSGDRYALWPASTKEALSVKAPVDRFLAQYENKSLRETFVPLPQVQSLLTKANVKNADVSRISLLRTVQDGGGWTFANGDIGYTEVISPVALLEVSRPAQEVLRALASDASSRETIGGSEVLVFQSFYSKEIPWYLAAPAEKVVAFGQKEGIEQILSVAAGQRDAIVSRRVLGPMLRDLENSDLLQAMFITPAQESSMPVIQTIATLLQAIPGPSLFFSLRAQASAYEERPDGGCILKIEYQAKGRAGGQIFKAVLWLMKTQITKEGGVVVSVDHEDGLARLIAVGEPYKCSDLEKTKVPEK